jgi:hypothetical protein
MAQMLRAYRYWIKTEATERTNKNVRMNVKAKWCKIKADIEVCRRENYKYMKRARKILVTRQKRDE